MSDFEISDNKRSKEVVECMQHNLRTPLNTILGYTQILTKAENLTCEQRQQIEAMHSSGELLLKRINDILETGKIRGLVSWTTRIKATEM